MDDLPEVEMQITTEITIPTLTGRNQDSFLRRLNTQSRKESGQSTIEFVMTFAFVIMFLGVFVRFAINVTNGYIVHYVTFKASRAMLVHDNNSNTESTVDQAAKAVGKEVFEEFLPNFDLNKVELRTPTDIGNSETSKNVFSGVVATFEQPFALGAMGGDTPLSMVSESFLGRIPPIIYCRNQTCEAVKLIGGPECSGNTTLVDNGC